ncbi:unnamed protein product, partial [Iphiclides podalirius]
MYYRCRYGRELRRDNNITNGEFQLDKPTGASEHVSNGRAAASVNNIMCCGILPIKNSAGKRCLVRGAALSRGYRWAGRFHRKQRGCRAARGVQGCHRLTCPRADATPVHARLRG